MAHPEQSAVSGVIGQLLSEGYRFGFFQAVRLLELWEGDRAPVGHDAAPQNEAVRFGSHASVEFPASQIYDVAASRDGTHPARMTVTFFGLNGPLGALPQHYTEIAIERLARKDGALLDFLDLFNHRLLSLFYRAWEKYQFWIAGEQCDFHEFTFSCYRRMPLLTNDGWRQELSRCIDVACELLSIELVAFVFMPEHVHMLVFPLETAPKLDSFLAKVKKPLSSYVKSN